MASTNPSTAAHAANTNSSAFKSTELPHLDGVEAAKRAAAYAAVDNHVKPNHEIIGIGSGKSLGTRRHASLSLLFAHA